MANTQNRSGNRPLLNVVAAQQKAMSSLEHENRVLRLQMAYVARLAGVSEHLAAIRKECDADNPAQPVPNPASQPATESTEETVTPLAYDNPNIPGASTNANQGIGAAETTTPLAPGTAIPTNPYNNLVDVTAPVAGTETHIPNNQTRIETDIRVGDPMNPEKAFPLNPAFGEDPQKGTKAPATGEMSQTKGASRTMASLRLAKLRLQAGLAQGDEFEVTAAIESDRSLSVERIHDEVEILSRMARVAGKRQQRPANLVPKAAAPQARVSLQTTASSDGSDDDGDFLW